MHVDLLVKCGLTAKVAHTLCRCGSVHVVLSLGPHHMGASQCEASQDCRWEGDSPGRGPPIHGEEQDRTERYIPHSKVNHMLDAGVLHFFRSVGDADW